MPKTKISRRKVVVNIEPRIVSHGGPTREMWPQILGGNDRDPCLDLRRELRRRLGR